MLVILEEPCHKSKAALRSAKSDPVAQNGKRLRKPPREGNCPWCFFSVSLNQLHCIKGAIQGVLSLSAKRQYSSGMWSSSGVSPSSWSVTSHILSVSWYLANNVLLFARHCVWISNNKNSCVTSVQRAWLQKNTCNDGVEHARNKHLNKGLLELLIKSREAPSATAMVFLRGSQWELDQCPTLKSQQSGHFNWLW